MSNEYRDWLRDECDELQACIAELEAENKRMEDKISYVIGKIHSTLPLSEDTCLIRDVLVEALKGD